MPEENSTEFRLTQEVFRNKFGSKWREAFEFPDVREQVLEDLRTELSQEIRTAFLNPNPDPHLHPATTLSLLLAQVFWGQPGH